jgi:[ribosomal protein S5]-alanine N-acetyltransferase
VCRLRPWTLADEPSLVRHADSRNVWRNLRDQFPHPYTATHAAGWLAYAAATPTPVGVYAIDVGGEAVGTISIERRADVQRASAEVGYWLGERLWGRGVATAALRAVTAAALAQPDIIRLFAYVFAWNRASMRVLEKVGYRREGVLVRSAIKDGTVVDEVLYGVTRDPGGPYAPYVPTA